MNTKPEPNPDEERLIEVLCNMSDEELQRALEFHDYHRGHILTQMKVRRNEKER